MVYRFGGGSGGIGFNCFIGIRIGDARGAHAGIETGFDAGASLCGFGRLRIQLCDRACGAQGGHLLSRTRRLEAGDVFAVGRVIGLRLGCSD